MIKLLFKGLSRAVVIAFVPAVFIAILVIAINQTFAVGLIAIVSSLIIQLTLRRKAGDKFAWSKYLCFSYRGFTKDEMDKKTFNILFNLARVLTIFGLFYLIYVNYSEILNPFGIIGVLLLVSLMIIAVLSLSFNRLIRKYQAIRGILATLVGLTIICFVYMTFKTQLIWVLLIPAIMFSAFDGFIEIEKAWVKKDVFVGISIAGTFLSAIVSTTIEFWSYIASFFIVIGNFIAEVCSDIANFLAIIGNLIVKVGAYEFFPSGQVWKVVLVLGVGYALVFLVRYLGKKDRAKKEFLKLQEEKAKKAAEEKRVKDEEKRLSDAAKKALQENLYKTIDELARLAEQSTLGLSNLVILSKAVNEFGFGFLDKFSVDSLVGIELEKFFTVSDIKQQIVWEPDFELVMKMYAALYARNYKDNDLAKIIRRFENLVTYLRPYEHYSSYKLIAAKVGETSIPL
ncbi:MAG: hypothetical protein ACOYL8_04005 [Patescibacteria group bacterium]